MDESLLLGQTWGDEEPTTTTNPTINSPGELENALGSPLTPAGDIDVSTPNEPSRRRSLIECFEQMLTIDNEDEADL